ncbi:hypothetical protein AC579_4484 [Pseudocercospora musae]|uniref:HypA-like protein n=1 Tax=Pseudocercospora musae TaxID=113226 RepID=A0A139GXJ6_9PEZI|nr:hypothetical protein AC579_4484 [Pseudocercospora musae]
MATARSVQLSNDHYPDFYRQGITQESSQKLSELLQENHDKYHIFFNADGFHNHIAHHLLTIWALKASPKDLQRGYNTNKGYQRPTAKPSQNTIQSLLAPENFRAHLGPQEHYNDFLHFFSAEIDKKGWQDVLKEYVFSRSSLADNMLVRMYAGFLHPIIHLGFGVEFQQPAIIAESLAQAAVHDSWIGDLLLPAEQMSKQNGNDKSIVQLLDEIRANKEISEGTKWEDGNKIRDGLLKRCPQPFLDIVSQVRVKPDQLEEKTAEMTNAAIYYTGGAQRANKVPKFDFYFIHCVNCSVFFPSFLKQSWLSQANKVRLLEWKIRLDLAMYASRKSPEIRLQDIRSYTPKKASGWDEIFDRVVQFDDDGHASKLIRAIASGEKICEAYEGKEGFMLGGGDWLQLGHMVIDSVERPGNNWVRSAGFDEAWEDVAERVAKL